MGREVEGRKERKKREGCLPGVMEFIHAVCLRLSSFNREEATIGIHTYLICFLSCSTGMVSTVVEEPPAKRRRAAKLARIYMSCCHLRATKPKRKIPYCGTEGQSEGMACWLGPGFDLR